jgi:hypothetical protein
MPMLDGAALKNGALAGDDVNEQGMAMDTWIWNQMGREEERLDDCVPLHANHCRRKGCKTDIPFYAYRSVGCSAKPDSPLGNPKCPDWEFGSAK